MADIIKINNEDLQPANKMNSAMETAQQLLLDTRSSIEGKNYLSVPIAQISTLGSGVSSLIPAFNTVTQTSTIAANGLYKIANGVAGDTLRNVKGTDLKWAALKGADGSSKMVKLQEVGSIEATSEAVAAFNPATMMMAVALFSIEQKLGNIEEMQKEILSFLEIEKKAEVKADLETLLDLTQKYKSNWDNEIAIKNYHKMVLDIQNSARAHMNSYQMSVSELLGKNKILTSQMEVEKTCEKLNNQFQYYRLSLYTFTWASFMEIMLSQNFDEKYISGIKSNVEKLTFDYRNLFDQGSLYLEKLKRHEIEANIVKGIGIAGEAVGEFIGKIPLIKKTPADEALQRGGSKLKDDAEYMKDKTLNQFAALSNPETAVFLEKMEDMIQIYNHTEQICFDNDNIYLVAN